MKEALHEFALIYDRVYEESRKMLNQHIKRVEKQFHNTPQAKRPSFDFIA